MKRFYERDLTSNPDSPFIRYVNGKLVPRSYWMDMDDRTFVMVVTKGIGAHLTNDKKGANLTDLHREYLIDQACVLVINLHSRVYKTHHSVPAYRKCLRLLDPPSLNAGINDDCLAILTRHLKTI